MNVSLAFGNGRQRFSKEIKKYMCMFKIYISNNFY